MKGSEPGIGGSVFGVFVVMVVSVVTSGQPKSLLECYGTSWSILIAIARSVEISLKRKSLAEID